MAAAPLSGSRLLLALISALSLLFIAHARLTLHYSDLEAIRTVQKGLGMEINRLASPCSLPGVVCERRLSGNGTNYVLRITRLVFESRELDGSIAPSIGRLSELKELSLPNNLLVDHLPPEILKCNKLEIINLKENRLSGKIPSALSSLSRLRVLDLESNRFSGDLSFLKHFPNLEKLSLAKNLFSGKIPASLRSFRNLRFLDLSGNNLLEGQIPQITQLELPHGEANPKRYILRENNSSARVNISQAPTSVQGPAPSAIVKHHKKHKRTAKKVGGWAIGFFAGALAGLLSGSVFSLMFKLLVSAIRGGSKGGPVLFSPLIKKKEDLAFLEKEDGLASLTKIGQGGCGEVYKGILPNGKEIAIKKINQPAKEAAELAEEESKLLHKKMRQIQSEIKTVGQIRHRNLLPLLAHVPRPNCHYLVYEFMKNGSLQDLLEKVREGSYELDWVARHRIAVGVASGLEYLHINHSQRIIHRDLKPGNVLLDDDMEARIADFGLAKAMPDAHTHITTSNVVGTLGYIAPEYHQTLKFTDKSDIYSFGILLAILVIGKLPSDNFFQNTEEMSLVKWLRNVMTSENPSRAIDAKLMGNGFEEQMLLVLKVAYFCTLDDPKQRPNSKNVRCMLTQIKH